MAITEPATCCVCGAGPSLTQGAVVKLPGTHRWLHRTCLDRDGELARTVAKRVARAVTFRERSQRRST